MRHLPFTHPSHFLKERDFGQKIEASFDFVRAHFRPLGRALLYIVLPAMLISGILSGLMQAQLMGMLVGWQEMAKSGNSAAVLSTMSDFFSQPEYWGAVIGGLISFVLLTLTVYGYLVLRLEKETSEEVTVREVWQLVRQRFGGAILAFLGLGLVFVVGMMGLGLVLGILMSIMRNFVTVILFVVGLYGSIFYFAVTLSLFFIIWMRERQGFFASLRRCFQLIWGKWWSTFGLLFVMGLLLMVVLILVSAVVSLIGLPFISAEIGGDTPPINRVISVVSSCIQSVVALGLYPLLLLAPAFQYFNLVERKEQEGTYLLVDAIGQPATPVAPRAVRPDEEGEY
ncbi:hypothetical protein [Hymenobacter koreensis]|uniref:Glycerophosphoryl diester phosphodiesterase membrane domain-containing protein n=1 Tax=Hymenobacter koreensis TaxID=1084523 RepID=A0ABP8IV85_9BACT